MTLISTIAIFASSSGALAANQPVSYPENLDGNTASSPIIEETTGRIYSESEYASLLVEKAGLTSQQATVRAEKVFSEMETFSNKRNARANYVQYFNRTVYPNASCKAKGWCAEYGFSATMTDGSTPLFVNIIDKWQTAGGSGPHEYVKVSTVSANKLSNTQVQLSGLGKLQVETTNGATVSGGINITSQELVGMGFQVSSTSGSTSYYRIDANINTIVKPSWMS